MSEELVQKLVAHEVFRLPPAAAGDPFNFINEALQFLMRWCGAYSGVLAHGTPVYTCLIGCERVSTDAASILDCEEQKLFRDDTPADLLGRIYLCAYPLSRVFGKTMAFNSLHDCESALASMGLSDRPVVFCNAAERRILWRLSGLSDLRQVLVRPAYSSTLTSARFDELLVEFHRNYTETPQGLSKPWLSAPKFLTKIDLEEEIRDDLYIFFRHLSPEPMSVLREFYNPAGRTDLLVCFPQEKIIYYIELKVLRSWKKNGANRSQVARPAQVFWGKKGIAQAHSYRRTNNYPGAGYACCFDARENDEELSELTEYADQMAVQYRRFFMYPSADALQSALMS